MKNIHKQPSGMNSGTEQQGDDLNARRGKKDLGNKEKDGNDGNAKSGRESIEKAHAQADRDISEDPEFSAHSPNDDLDEGETARLGENNTGLI